MVQILQKIILSVGVTLLNNSVAGSDCRVLIADVKPESTLAISYTCTIRVERRFRGCEIFFTHDTEVFQQLLSVYRGIQPTYEHDGAKPNTLLYSLLS